MSQNQSPPDLPNPSEDEVREALLVGDEVRAQAQAFPPAEVWRAEFPDLYHQAEGSTEYSVDYRHPGMSRQEQERNSRRVLGMLKRWQAVCSETSRARSERVPTVTVRDRQGHVANLPAKIERSLSKNHSHVPYWGKGTTYWTDPKSGRKWKRHRGGDWIPDED